MKEIFDGVYKRGNQIYTMNAVPGRRVYGERILKEGGKEFRSWNPYRSKMAAAILKGLKNMPVKRNSVILYLGVANGTTASHFSDIATDGMIYGIEISFKAMRDFVEICRERKNLIPVMADANKTWMYEEIVEEIDLIYQDIAQRNQIEIFLKNMKKFEAEHGVIMVKARSIDISMKPDKIFSIVKKEIGKGYEIKEAIKLSPYAKDHIAIFI